MGYGLSLPRAFVVAVTLILVAVPAAGQDRNDVHLVTMTLAIRGNVAVPATLSVADLRQFPVQRVEDSRTVRGGAGSSEVKRELAGCRLRDVLNAAKLTERDRLDLDPGTSSGCRRPT